MDNICKSNYQFESFCVKEFIEIYWNQYNKWKWHLNLIFNNHFLLYLSFWLWLGVLSWLHSDFSNNCSQLRTVHKGSGWTLSAVSWNSDNLNTNYFFSGPSRNTSGAVSLGIWQPKKDRNNVLSTVDFFIRDAQHGAPCCWLLSAAMFWEQSLAWAEQDSVLHHCEGEIHVVTKEQLLFSVFYFYIDKESYLEKLEW